VCHGHHVQMDADTCWDRLRTDRHGVLGTMHATRGVDAVPVVFVVNDDRDEIVIPIDTVKPKGSGRLQRLRNLDGDDRAVLIVEHYDDDWSQLLWVRVHGRAHEAEPTPEQLQRLAAAFPAYTAPGSVTSVIVLAPTDVTGWSAGARDVSAR
jgi:PPOX class probable F420-dependent enzyme